MFSCLFHGQVFVIPTGVDAAMDAIQFALLACSSYDWASLERGFIVLQESLCRYHRRHASPTACMLSTSMTLLRRQRPWHMDDEEIALSVQRFLDAVSATLPHRFLGDEIVVIFFSCGTNMGSYFRFFLCVCVCGETLFLYVRTEAVQSEMGQSLDYTPGYVDVMDTPTFWAKNTPISPGTPPSASRIIPVFRQQAIPIVFCAGTLHSTRIPFFNVDYRNVNTMKFTYLTHKNIELSTPCLQVLDSPDMLRWRVPTLDLVSDDEDPNAQPVPESVSCLRPPRWRRGILHPPAGSVIEMDLPNVTVEDCFCGSTVYILNKCVNGMKDPIYLQSCTHAFDITPMSSWQAFANWSMPIFVSYIFARNFFPHAIVEELFRLPIYWQAHCAGRQCPNWATSFLSGFDWTSARLEALLASVLQPDVDPEPLVMNVTPSNTDWSEGYAPGHGG